MPAELLTRATLKANLEIADDDATSDALLDEIIGQAADFVITATNRLWAGVGEREYRLAAFPRDVDPIELKYLDASGARIYYLPPDGGDEAEFTGAVFTAIHPALAAHMILTPEVGSWPDLFCDHPSPIRIVEALTAPATIPASVKRASLLAATIIFEDRLNPNLEPARAALASHIRELG